MTIYAHAVDSPVGKLVVTVDRDNRVTRLLFAKERSAERLLADTQEAIEWSSNRCQTVRTQLTEYFAGKRRAFDLELNPSGTLFQKSVWKVLRTIPFGQTRSYGEIAQELNKPGASRAVGRANGTNPISIMVPCHRVIGADGSLTGFGGGMEAKRTLLLHEGASFVAANEPLLPGFGAVAV
jgi:methylated-DNA-[protein]-cysteine S-methyltransferase